jgi:tetratricopeptide (TPR) repeat protein
LGDRFVIDKPAGQGGMGAVFRARDATTGELVAVKIVAPSSADQRARFVREVAVLASLSDPSIVRYVAHGDGPEPENAFLAMEWIEGPSLREVVAHDTLSVVDTARCGLGIARALAAAHAAGVVHRDIKPGNVMLAGGSFDAVKLVDFGVARPALRTDELTIAGSIVGTVGYMAPEQAKGSDAIGPAADVYALGSLLFRCLTGRMPFVGDEIVAVLVRLVLEDAPRVASLRPDVPRWLDDLIASMLAREPEYRPSHALDIVARIERHMTTRASQRPRSMSPAPGEARAAITSSERRIGCAVLAAAGALGFTPLFDDEERRDLEQAAQAFGAEVCILADGSVLATITAEGTAADRAARAARTALVLRRLLVGMPLCVLVGSHAPGALLTEPIDRVVSRLKHDAAFAIRLDETAAGLLHARFELGTDALGLFLRSERDAAEVACTLLGKPTPCVGREREIALILGLISEVASEGVARVAVVTAEPGAGKSRLRYETMRRALAERPDLTVWLCSSDPLAAGSPFSMLGQALRRTASITSTDSLEVARKKLRSRVGRHVAATEAQGVTEFLGEICSVTFDDAASPPLRAARREPALMADQVLRAFETFLSAECAAGPVVLVLEDLHWGDLPSVRLIDSALRHEHPLFVLALARPEVHARFPDLFRSRSLTDVVLASLSKKAAARLVREVLGELVEDALVQRIVELSVGNAFYLEELIRAASSGVATLPETVIAMAQSILDTLASDARMALRAGSIFGGSFDIAGLAALLDLPAREARALVEPLVQAELLALRDATVEAGSERYVFRHALLREAAYAMLDEDDRALGHRIAAAFLVGRGEHDPMVLAEHFERGEQPELATRHYLRAAEQALAGNDLADANARAERGVGCGARDEELGLLRLVQAEAERWRGRNAEGAERAREALSLLRAGSAPWCSAVSELASCALKLLVPDTLDDLGRRLLAGAQEAGDHPSAALVIAFARVAASALLAGHTTTANALLEVLRSPAACATAEAPEVFARAGETHAIAALLAGDMGAFLVSSEAAADAFSAIGDSRSLAIQRANQGHVYGALGAYERAEAALRHVLEATSQIAVPQLLAAAQQNLGNVLSREGRHDEARALLNASLVMARAQEDRRLEVGARIYLSRSAFETRDAEAALAYVAEPVLPKGSPALHAYALAARARALLLSGRDADAASAADEAMGALDAAGGGMEEGETFVRLAHAEALIATGREADARAALARAREGIEARAARITTLSLRKSFLEDVPENARVLSLCAERAGTKDALGGAMEAADTK